MKRIAADRLPFPALVLTLFICLCLGAGYLVIYFSLPQSLLLLLLAAILISMFYYPDWLIYSMLGIWAAVMLWYGSQPSTGLWDSLLQSGLTAVVSGGILILFHFMVKRRRNAYETLTNRFRALAEFTLDFEYWESPEGKLAYVSPACEQVTGYTPAEFRQNPDLRFEIILPEDREKVKESPSITKAKPSAIMKSEVRIYHRNGQIRWIELTQRQVFDENGRYHGKRVRYQDITHRKQELENLNLMYERLLWAMDSTEDGVWDINLKDGVANFIPRYATLLGFKPDETVPLKDYYSLVHPDDLSGMLDALRMHLSWQSSSYEAEYRLLTRYGKWRWVLDRGRIITLDTNGKPARMVGTHVDITERKLIKEALEQSEEKFRQLTENMREVFWLRDRESGRFIYISAAFVEIWGRPTEKLYEEPNVFVESIHLEDFVRVYYALKELVGSGVVFNEEYRVVRPDQSLRWVWARAYPIYDANHDYYRIAGIVEDITERKESDSALRESEKRYRDLIEHQGGGVSIIDPQQTIAYMNPAGEDIFGMPRGSITSRNLREFLDDEQFSFITRQSSLPQGTESSFEMAILRPDKEKRNLLVTATPRFDASGQFLGTIVNFKDMTQNKEREDKLRYIGLHDTLTGLFNRTFFEDEIRRLEMDGIFPVGIIVVDADGLKLVNDQLGHAAGDDLLIRSARVLKKSVRSDDVIARIGGDEFAILMPNCDENSLHHVLNRIETIVRGENELGEVSYLFSLSAGGYTCHTRGTLKASVDKADERMYELKNKKKKHYLTSLPTRNPKDQGL